MVLSWCSAIAVVVGRQAVCLLVCRRCGNVCPFLVVYAPPVCFVRGGDTGGKIGEKTNTPMGRSGARGTKECQKGTHTGRIEAGESAEVCGDRSAVEEGRGGRNGSERR